MDHQLSVKHKSTTIKTLWPAHTTTSSMHRPIGAYSIGLTIAGKHGFANKKKNGRKKAFFQFGKVFGNDLLTRLGTNLRLPINYLFSSDNWTEVKQLFLKVTNFVTARQQCPINTLVCTETRLIFFVTHEWAH